MSGMRLLEELVEEGEEFEESLDELEDEIVNGEDKEVLHRILTDLGSCIERVEELHSEAQRRMVEEIQH